MPNGVTLVLFLAGPIVMIGYVASSVVRGWIVASGDRSTPSTVAEAITTVSVACAAWLAIRSVAPGRTTFQNASAIGFLSSQVLTAWSSLALWAGVGAVLGQVAPVTRRFHSGSAGVAGAFALLVVFLPVTAVAALGAWSGSLALTRNIRSALVSTCFAVVAAEWLLGVLNPRSPYGLIHGPETALFVAVLAGVLIVRWTASDLGIDSRSGEKGPQ